MGRLIDQTRVRFAVGLAGDLVMNGGATVLDHALQDDQGVHGRVRIGREHFLLDQGQSVLWAGEREGQTEVNGHA